jgi:hypothetical protein
MHSLASQFITGIFPIHAQKITINMYNGGNTKNFILDDILLLTEDSARLDVVNFDADSYLYTTSEEEDGGLVPWIFPNSGIDDTKYLEAQRNVLDGYLDIMIDLGEPRNIFNIVFPALQGNIPNGYIDYQFEFYIDDVLVGTPYIDDLPYALCEMKLTKW